MVDLNKIRQKYKELQDKTTFAGADFLELQGGDNVVRFLSDENGEFYKETAYHYFKPSPKETKAIVCLKTMDQPCFFCDIVAQLRKTKDESDAAMAKEISARPRIFYNVIDRKDGKIKVLGSGNSIFKDLLRYFADEDWGDLTDLSAGHDVVINKTGQGMQTEYTVMPKPKPCHCGLSGEFELWDLDALVTPISYEAQRALFEGEEAPASAGQPAAAPPAAPAPAPAPAAPAAPAPAPKPRSRGTAAPATPPPAPAPPPMAPAIAPAPAAAVPTPPAMPPPMPPPAAPPAAPGAPSEIDAEIDRALAKFRAGKAAK